MVFELIFIVLRRAKTEPDSMFFIIGWMVWQLASCPERVELAALAPLATGALLGTSSAHLGTAIPNILKKLGKIAFRNCSWFQRKSKTIKTRPLGSWVNKLAQSWPILVPSWNRSWLILRLFWLILVLSWLISGAAWNRNPQKLKNIEKHWFPLVFVYLGRANSRQNYTIWHYLKPSWRHLGRNWRQPSRSWCHLGADLGPSCAPFGSSWSYLGLSWHILGASWNRNPNKSKKVLKKYCFSFVFVYSGRAKSRQNYTIWRYLGQSWRHLGPTWRHLGRSWCHLGPSWSRSWFILRLSWLILGLSWPILAHLGRIL